MQSMFTIRTYRKNNIKLCPNCSQDFHLGEHEDSCSLTKSCIICKEESLDLNHCTIDKKCPIFLKEKEIQAIITQEKVSKKKAVTIYRERHHNTNTTFSAVLKNHSNLKNHSSQPTTNPTENINKISTQRILQDYSSIISDVDISENEVNNMETQSVFSLSGTETSQTKSKTIHFFSQKTSQIKQKIK